MSAPSDHAPTERRPDRAAFAIGIGLGVLGLLVLLDASQIGGGAYARIGPATFPFLIGGALVILAGWTMFEAWRGDFPERDHDEIAPIIWIVGGLAAQLLLLTTAGFSIATASSSRPRPGPSASASSTSRSRSASCSASRSG